MTCAKTQGFLAKHKVGVTAQADAKKATIKGDAALRVLEGVDDLYVASGCCVGGLSLSPAAGRALADLIVDGKSDPDLGPLSVERFRGRWEDAADLEAACIGQYARRYTR